MDSRSESTFQVGCAAVGAAALELDEAIYVIVNRVIQDRGLEPPAGYVDYMADGIRGSIAGCELDAPASWARSARSVPA